jgi:predicted RNA-binding protein with RPS1 domain
MPEGAAFLGRRLVHAFIVVIGITFVVAAMIRLVPGDPVDVMVLNLDKEHEKISLGIKQTESNPWVGVEERYPVRKTVKGVVRNLTEFGAFVELEEGIDGLIHVSDMSWTKKVGHPKDVLKKGQEVEAMVISVDPTERKISLSIKALTHAGEASEIEAYVQKGKAQPKPGSLGSMMGEDLREALSGKGGKKGKKGRRDSE